MDWNYRQGLIDNDAVMQVGHVRDWMSTLDYWGNDLIDGPSRRETWLGRYMLETGTTPTPIIVATNAGGRKHPREHDAQMVSPMQLIEGHMRLAYLRALIRHQHPNVKQHHEVIFATLP